MAWPWWIRRAPVYAGRVLKRANLLVAIVCVLSVEPAIALVRELESINRHWIVRYDYRILSLAISETGAWTFIFLYLALACTPVQRFTGMRWPGELRRTLGLLAFLYGLLHFVAYILVGQKLRWDYAYIDAHDRWSRIPGWLALVLLVPLALTSTDGMVRRLGGKRWKRLHFLVFPAAALAILHVYWSELDNLADHHKSQNALIPFLVLIAARLIWKGRGYLGFKSRSARG